MQKALNKGEIWFLHNEDEKPTEYEIIDSGIYLTDKNYWDASILFINKENNNPCHVSLWMFIGLTHTGEMYKKDQEKMAETLRAAIKNKNLNSGSI